METAEQKADMKSVSYHPLDPLSSSELEIAARIIREHTGFGETLRFVSIALDEPARERVERYVAGSPIERKAFAVLLDRKTRKTYEALVDLGTEAIVTLTELPRGIQPGLMLDEFFECEQAVRKDPQFLAALERRGISDPELVMIAPWSAGFYGTEPPEFDGRRLMQVLCFLRSEERDNGYARPLDNLVVFVDLHELKVIRLDDYGVVPVPPESGNWAREYIANFRSGLKPIEILQPEGVSFTVTGHEVEWQNWKFRVGFTAREGLVLHAVRYVDGGQERPVLQRASVCEMVVPYAEPGEAHYRKNAFDIGEYGLGMLANSLTLGCDCLGVIHYFDFPLVDSMGRVRVLRHAVCLHEEDHGISWKHTDWRTNQSEVRRSRRLSISFIATVGNYEYGFYWYFYQDGSLQCEVKLTGIMNTTTLAPGTQSRYGVEVAPRLNAGHHQHIFAARLVPCVDGPANSVYEVNTVPLPPGPENPHGNAFVAEETLLATEQQAQRQVNSNSARFWRVANPGRKNRVGRPVAYRLVPGENSPPMAHPESGIMRRAGFTRNHLWVTPFRENERFAAGEYPNQHPTGDGLPVWTKADRPVEDTELSVWYVFSHTHIPRPEDWPVMPAGAIGFQWKPDGFFDRSPALDLPPTNARICCED